MNRALRVLYITVILFASCEQPTKTEYVYEEVEVERVVTETEYIEVEVEPEIVEIEVIKEVEVEKEVIKEVEITTIEYITEYVDNTIEIEIEKEIIVTTNEQAITEYSNYVTTDNKVYGISEGNFIEIENITGLYKKDDVLYFNMEVTTVTDDVESKSINAYSQKDGVLTLLDGLDEPPISGFTEFKEGVFKIVTDEYKDITYSYVYNGTRVTGYSMVDGACIMDNDLLFSVPTTLATRYKGIYKYDSKDGCPRLKFDSGRIW